MNKPHEPNRLTDYLDLTPEAVDAIKREAESEERQEPGGAAENVGEREAEVIIAQSSVPEMETARTEAEIIETVAVVEWERGKRSGEPQFPSPGDLAEWLLASDDANVEPVSGLQDLYPVPVWWATEWDTSGL